MDILRTFLEQQILLTMFLVIGLGYAVGQVNIRGFNLGVGAVLFVGLGVGMLAPNASPPALLGSLGLVMFVYGIGIQYGKQFFAGLTSPFGLKVNALALVSHLVADRRVLCGLRRLLGRAGACRRLVCRRVDEHADTPGGHRRGRQQ